MSSQGVLPYQDVFREFFLATSLCIRDKLIKLYVYKISYIYIQNIYLYKAALLFMTVTIVKSDIHLHVCN